MTNYIAMRLKPTSRTAIYTSLGFVPSAAVRTSLGRITFVHVIDNTYSLSFSFVFHILANFPVVPLADLLIGLLRHSNAISCISDIAYNNGIGLTFPTDLNNRFADFVLYVPDNPFVLCLETHLGAHKPRAFSGTFPGSGNRFVNFSQTLIVSLLFMAQFTAGDDDGFLLIPNNSRVNFSKIDRNDVAPFRRFGPPAVFNNDMPEVLLGFLLMNQTYFQNPQNIPQIFRKFDYDLPISIAIGKTQYAIFILDGCVLPNGCPKPLAPIRKLNIRNACLARFPGSLAGFIKSFLGSVYCVGMKAVHSPAKEIVYFHGLVLRKPDFFFSVCSPMIDTDLGVDTPRFHIEKVANRPRQVAWDNVSADQYIRTALPTTCSGPTNPQYRES